MQVRAAAGYSPANQRKLDDQTRAHLFAKDDELEAMGLPRHYVYDWTVANFTPMSSSRGLEDLL